MEHEHRIGRKQSVDELNILEIFYKLWINLDSFRLFDEKVELNCLTFLKFKEITFNTTGIQPSR